VAEAKIQIRADGGEGAVAAFDRLQKSADETQKTLKKAFAAGVIADSVGRLSDAFDGTAKTALQASATMAKAFLAGGPVGLAVAGLSLVVEQGLEAWKEYKAEGSRAAEAVATEIENAAKRIKTARESQEASAERLQAIEAARRSGGSVAAAELEIKRAKILAQIEGQRVTQAAQIRFLMSKGATEDVEAFNAIARQEVQASAIIQGLEEDLKATKAEQKVQFAEDYAQRKAALEQLTQLMATQMDADENARIDSVLSTASQTVDIEKARLETIARLKESAAEREQEQFDRDAAAAAERAATEERAAAQFIKDRRQREEEAIASAAAKEEQRARAVKEQQDATKAEREKDQELAQAREEAVLTGSLGVLKDIATGQGDVTKAALESKAQQAAIEAAFQTATGLGLLAIGSPSAASAFTAAAQFAAIAATAGVASLAASSAPAAPAASQGGRSGGSGPSSGGGSGTNITVVLPQSGRLYPMNDELLRGVRAANREASRR